MTEDRDIRESQGTGTKMRERSATQEAILRAKLEWERTFDSVPDLIAIFDRNHRIVRLNRAMAERSGRPPAACIGPACYESVHCRAAPIKDCPHVFTLLDGQDHTAEVHEEQFGGDFMVTTSPLKDLDGQIVGSVHIARDITEQKRVEQREQEALATVTASRTAVDILGAMVSRNGNCQEFYEVELPQFSSAGRRKGRRPLVETPLSRLVSASGYSGVDRSILGGETPSNAPRSGDRVRTCSLFRIRRCSMKSMKTENRWTRTEYEQRVSNPPAMFIAVKGQSSECSFSLHAIFVPIVVLIVVGPHLRPDPCRRRSRRRFAIALSPFATPGGAASGPIGEGEECE